MRVLRLAFNTYCSKVTKFLKIFIVARRDIEFPGNGKPLDTPSSGLTATFSHRKALWEKGFYFNMQTSRGRNPN
jgi:hypothetical protein